MGTYIHINRPGPLIALQVMSLPELKECLGMSLPDTKHRLFSFLGDSQYRSDEDSVVDQSFIQEFNSHFITEPPLQQHSSPLLSSFTHSVSDSINNRDIAVSPISSVGLSSSSIDTGPHTTTACSSPLTGNERAWERVGISLCSIVCTCKPVVVTLHYMYTVYSGTCYDTPVNRLGSNTSQ